MTTITCDVCGKEINHDEQIAYRQYHFGQKYDLCYTHYAETSDFEQELLKDDRETFFKKYPYRRKK